MSEVETRAQRLARIDEMIVEMDAKKPGNRCCGECCSAEGCGNYDDLRWLRGLLGTAKSGKQIEGVP